MPSYLDLSKSYLYFDGTEAVTFRQATANDTYATGLSLAYAKRRAPTKDEVQLLPDVELVWHLWKDHLGAVEPKIHDVIEDAGGVRWQVLKVEIHSRAERFRCSCFKEVS